MKANGSGGVIVTTNINGGNGANEMIKQKLMDHAQNRLSKNLAGANGDSSSQVINNFIQNPNYLPKDELCPFPVLGAIKGPLRRNNSESYAISKDYSAAN